MSKTVVANNKTTKQQRCHTAEIVRLNHSMKTRQDQIVLLAYSRGLISSRAIERACQQNVQFMALSGDLAPSYTHHCQVRA